MLWGEDGDQGMWRRKSPFKGRQFTSEVILWAVRWYLQFRQRPKPPARTLRARKVAAAVECGAVNRMTNFGMPASCMSARTKVTRPETVRQTGELRTGARQRFFIVDMNWGF
ncbi:hypothetical protein IGS68_30895 (plasmid) [Skermanella sp. TT6]|uniref:Transposase n=1 Tax=Skermanella cutis TaxID=2775420 RepID=A0ABX7BGX3_9PROT|nr:hypothetical protein [Skermanella sp. TT6]QQP92850.1 hypothetical protein IGS68_30895 [Skermanella sp. TT6]